MPPLPADSIHARACKLKCEKILTRPSCLLNHLLRKLVFPDPDCPPSKKAVGDSTAFLLEPILLNYHLSDSQTVCQ